MKRMAMTMTKGLPAVLAACALLAPSLAHAQRVEYYHLDGLGSARAITDEQGEVVERHDYLPFGEEWNPEPGSQPRKFTGKERDEETGWDYFGARYYEASLARFTAIDPVTTFDENRVDPQRWNRYAYVRNNPMRYVDPDGEVIDTAWDVVNIGLGVASLVSNLQEGNYFSAALDAGGVALDSAAAAVPFVPGGFGTLIKGARVVDKADDAIDLARGLAKGSSKRNLVTREGRLRQLVDDANVSSTDRGWIRNEIRQVQSGNRRSIRNPPGKDLRHPAGRARAQGYDYSETLLQYRASHRSQHRYLVERSTGTSVRIPKTPAKPGPELPK